jgi:cytochrome b561
MKLKNTNHSYGSISIALHWLVAFTAIGLFFLGWWMTGLTYYDEWYRRGPDIHRSVGVLLFFIMLIRLVWRNLNIVPAPEPGIPLLQQKAAHLVHLLLYLILFALLISGYLISTADGRAISVFNLFTVPSTITYIPNQEDIAGVIHWYLALGLMGLSILHSLAALKHHFINRDRTLIRMLGISAKNNNHTKPSKELANHENHTNI